MVARRVPRGADGVPEAGRTRLHEGPMCRYAVLITATLVVAPAFGCQKILGIHDIDAGPSPGDEGGGVRGGSGSSSGVATGSGSGVTSSGASSGNASSGIGPSSGSASGGDASGEPGCAIEVSGNGCTISSNTHWTRGFYAIECDVRVDAALTIDPGATLMFDTGHSMLVSGTGTLNASGTAAAPIVFTSVRDNVHGCSTGGTVAPAARDWNGITVNASGSTFDHCAFYYAGGSDSAALGVSDGNRVTVTNSIFGHNEGPTDSPSATSALEAGGAAAGTVIKSNVFYDNRIPLRISTNFSIDDSNSYDNSAAAPMNPQPNEYNGIDFVGGNSCGVIAGNVTWSATKVPFIIGRPGSAGLCVRSGGQLALGPNVTMKFFPGGSLQVDGTSTLTTGGGDIFTSMKDDSHGGDTNADQAATSPAPGDWNGIDLTASGLTLDHCSFLYAGGSDSAALLIDGSQATVTNSTFAHNQGPTDSFEAAPALDGATAAANTVIKSNVFYDNRIPLRISTNFSLDDSNAFDNSAVAPTNAQPNEYNGIDFVGGNSCGVIASNVTWSVTKIPFIIGTPSGAGLCVRSGGSLILGPNVTMKFFAGGSLVVDGTSTLTTGSGDVFTSIKDKDPAHGGDTDPGSGAPAAGDWSGIVENGVCETWPNIYYSTSGCP